MSWGPTGDAHRPRSIDEFVDRWFWAIVAVLTTVLVAVFTIDALLLVRGLDLRVYQAGGYAWSHDVPLYSDRFGGLVSGDVPLPFTYPPLSAILFAPLSVLPFLGALVVHTLINIGMLLVVCLIVTLRRYPARRVAIVAALALTSVAVALEPVRETLHFGQVNLILLALICADCLLPRTRLPRGLLVGIAAAIKLTPAVFVLYFVARRDWRAAATSVATFVGAGLLAFALAPGDSRQYWFHTLLNPERIGGISYAYNQSLNRMLNRLGLTGDLKSALWALGALAVIVLGMLAARRAQRAGDDLASLLAIAAVGLVVSPVSWDHHWVWIVPATFGLVSTVRHGRGVWRWLSVVVLATFVLPFHAMLASLKDETISWVWWQQLVGNSYLFIAVGTILYLQFRSRPDDGVAPGIPAAARRVEPSRSPR